LYQKLAEKTFPYLERADKLYPVEVP
jgi:hypothetical protein